MRKLLYILFLLLSPVLGFSQATSVSIGTSSIGTLSSTYNTWTKVDPNLTLTSNGTITGFRVQISQTYTSGDLLRSTATLPSGVTATFNSTTGILVFGGTTTSSNWETILRGVEFKSTTSTKEATIFAEKKAKESVKELAKQERLEQKESIKYAKLCKKMEIKNKKETKSKKKIKQ